MSLVSGTYTKYDLKGGREALSDAIYNISPEETPFVSGAGRGPAATATLDEWQTDSLRAGGANAQLEGDQAAFTTPTATVRVGNYLQISRETVIVSGTAEAINKAGRKSEVTLQVMKKGKELRLDQEVICLRAQAGDAGGVGTARTLAGLNAWLKTNTNFYTTDGGDPTYTSGVPAAVRTDGGTLRAFTETIAKDVMSQGYTAGAKFSTLMVGPFNKTVVSAFSGVVTRNYDISNASPKPTAVIAAIDVYVGDFHTVRVVPNRNQRERDAWFIDWNFVELGYLRPHFLKPLGETGDAHRRMLLTEWTLRVKNEAAIGGAFDLTTA